MALLPVAYPWPTPMRPHGHPRAYSEAEGRDTNGPPPPPTALGRRPSGSSPGCSLGGPNSPSVGCDRPADHLQAPGGLKERYIIRDMRNSRGVRYEFRDRRPLSVEANGPFIWPTASIIHSIRVAKFTTHVMFCEKAYKSNMTLSFPVDHLFPPYRVAEAARGCVFGAGIDLYPSLRHSPPKYTIWQALDCHQSRGTCVRDLGRFLGGAKRAAKKFETYYFLYGI